jgi:hypothetical protein
MNERIFELAKQADLIQWDTLPSGARTPDHESVVKARKFAELIVRECARIVNENDCEGSIVGDGMLFEHFGVEE